MLGGHFEQTGTAFGAIRAEKWSGRAAHWTDRESCIHISHGKCDDMYHRAVFS